MALNLSAQQVSALETRTEGWIAGLQLAALSMRGREDAAQFVRAFAGDNRYIVDYLVEEVLQRQPERVRSFLLQTSILDRLSGPLCDAVTGQNDGDGAVRCPGARQPVCRAAGRYAPLVSLPPPLCRCAGCPCAAGAARSIARSCISGPAPGTTDNGLPADAIRHALAAEDFARAAGLIELAWPAMDGRFQSATWLGWARSLPDELVRARPVLSVAYAWALLNGGELEAAEAWFGDAERWLDLRQSAVSALKPLRAGSQPSMQPI